MCPATLRPVLEDEAIAWAVQIVISGKMVRIEPLSRLCMPLSREY